MFDTLNSQHTIGVQDVWCAMHTDQCAEGVPEWHTIFPDIAQQDYSNVILISPRVIVTVTVILTMTDSGCVYNESDHYFDCVFDRDWLIWLRVTVTVILIMTNSDCACDWEWLCLWLCLRLNGLLYFKYV